MIDIAKIEDMIANAEPLEFFDDYADQEEISSALQEMLDREMYQGPPVRSSPHFRGGVNRPGTN
jgi:hypothetical protein